MALRESPVDPRLTDIVDAVARKIGPLGAAEGGGKPASLKMVPEFGVNRMIQAYWTPFLVNVPGNSVGLHLDSKQGKHRWAEAYLSHDYENWVLCFHERDDGNVQLAYYANYPTYQEAIEGFVDLTTWYTLTPADLSWSDVGFEVDESLGWTEHLQAVGTGASAAIGEALKKSTIMWLRWNDNGTERTMPVWFVYDNKTEKIYVLSGERQQTIPGAEKLREVTMVLRWKGKNSQVAEMNADVRVLEPGPEWDEVAEKIAEKRLNIPGLPEDTARRWRDECVILELSAKP